MDQQIEWSSNRHYVMKLRIVVPKLRFTMRENIVVKNFVLLRSPYDASPLIEGVDGNEYIRDHWQETVLSEVADVDNCEYRISVQDYPVVMDCWATGLFNVLSSDHFHPSPADKLLLGMRLQYYESILMESRDRFIFFEGAHLHLTPQYSVRETLMLYSNRNIPPKAYANFLEEEMMLRGLDHTAIEKSADKYYPKYFKVKGWGVDEILDHRKMRFARSVPAASLSHEEREYSCPACFEKIGDTDGNAMITGCDHPHYFHENCLMEWFKHGNSCPICRAPSYPLGNPDDGLRS